MISIFALGLASCATTPKEQAAVEVQPSEEELERQRQEEMERQRQDELDRMREQEMALAETEAAPPPAMEEPMATMPADVSELGTVYFDFDKYDLRPDARDTLAANAEWLKSNSGIQIQIEGHCDERGTVEYNLALGERRANAVKSYLVSLGVDDARLFTISYGEEMPADPGHNQEAWAKNRRAQFKTATTQF